MSMEQAILEHAGALRELAAAIKSMGNAGLPVRVGGYDRESVELTPLTEGRVVKQKGELSPELQAHKEELLKPQTKTASTDADKALIKERGYSTGNPQQAEEPAPAAVEPDAELEAAVSKVEEEESKALDYKTDVRPVLLALAKKAGQPALKDLLTKYGAATGDKLTADQFAGIVADANALIAG